MEIILEKAKHRNGQDFKVVTNKETGCWECLDRRPRFGGVGHIPYKNTYAHRYFYEKFKGVIPKGLLVRHLCNNAKCCNPDHLDVGTKKDNVDDMMKSFRNKNGRSSLNKEDIIYICGSLESTKELAEKFKVNTSTINRIRSGESYKFLNVKRTKVGKKINSKQAMEIFDSELDWKELAKKYNVKYTTIYDIKKMNTWRKFNEGRNIK